jgi:predicted ThiF/HesA family dinucleotide-utilizing enzyme
MPPVVAIIRSAINSALIFLLEKTKREENAITMVKRLTNIAFTKEVKVLERYMLLKSNSDLVKLETIMVIVTAQITKDKRREA